MSHAHSGVQRSVRRILYAGVATTMATFMATSATPPSAWAHEIHAQHAGTSVKTRTSAKRKPLGAEPFTKAQIAIGDWVFPGIGDPNNPDYPCLTASTEKPGGQLMPGCVEVLDGSKPADPDGEGAFRLTDASRNDAGALVLNRPIPSGAGLHFTFDIHQYGGQKYRDNTTETPRGGDGMSVFLFDGSVGSKNISDIRVGQTGAGLGYAGNNDASDPKKRGVAGAIAGIGFDEYGNFSNSAFFGGDTKPHPVAPNSVVVRAGEQADYAYVEGTTLDPHTIAEDVERQRSDITTRTVNVDLSTAGLMNVYMDFHDGKGIQHLLTNLDLTAIPGQPKKLPPTIKIGMAASTGLATNIHELANTSVTTLDPVLVPTAQVTKPFTAGGTGEVSVTVKDKPADGPTTGDITTTFTVPAGITPTAATGTGWSCTVSGQTVTCTRPGAGAAALKPGDTTPPIVITGKADRNAPDKVTATTVATTPDQHMTDPPSNTTTVDIPIGKPTGPDLTPTATGDGTSVTSTVANQGNGPTTGDVTLVTPVPAGAAVSKVEPGPGWTCTTAPEAVTCTRPGDGGNALKPGDTSPPVKVTFASPDGSPVTGTTSPNVNTPGDLNPDNDTAKPVNVSIPDTRPKGPDLTPKITADGPTVTGTVSNDPKATPTTGDTALTIDVPKGATVDKIDPGSGWKCTSDSAAVVCTTSSVIQPGATTPPVKVTFTTPDGTALTGQSGAKNNTPGDTNPGNDTAPPVDVKIPAKEPNLARNCSGDGATLACTVSNDPKAGPTHGDVTLHVPIPDGTTVDKVTPGDGWKCTQSATEVTCTRPGDGDNSLKPGKTTPPVEITFGTPDGTGKKGTTTPTTSTTGDPGTGKDNPPITIDIPAKGPDLSPTLTANGPVLTGTVSNDPKAGPTTDPTSLTIDVPKGTVVDKVEPGSGWTCTPAATKVTCTTKNVIKPGSTTPPVKVTLSSADGSAVSGTSTGTAKTPGDTNPANDTTTAVPVKVPAREPKLQRDCTSDANGTVTCAVSNDPKAGPTHGPISLVIPVPTGATVDSVNPGPDWTCTTAADAVTCTRPGDGDKSLYPGGTTPPVSVTFKSPDGSPIKGTTDPQTKTDGDTGKGNDKGPVPVTVPGVPPNLNTVLTAAGPVLTATVSNGPNAGPTTGEITLKIPVPDGTTVVKTDAAKPWKCSTTTAMVTCTTTGALKRGAAEPPVKVTLAPTGIDPVDATATATVATPGDSDNSDDTGTTDVHLPGKGPDLSPTLTVSDDGRSVAATVTDDPAAGRTNGPITLTIPVPKGATVVKVDPSDWTCKTAATVVTCTRPGTGDKQLNPGDTTQPVTVTFGSPNGTAVTGNTTATVKTPGDTDPTNDTSKPGTVSIPAVPPNLAIALGTQGNFVPGGAAVLTATVSNNKAAGPTAGPVKVTIPVPTGMSVAKTTAPGWSCSDGKDGNVVCTRPGTGKDTLRAGQKYPPVTVNLVGNPDMTGTSTASAQVDVDNDSDTSDNSAGPITLPQPGLQVAMNITPNPYSAGNQLDYTITVTNTGDTDAKGVRLQADVSKVWGGVPWTCTASDGGKCPANAGAGAIDTMIDVAAGGTVTFTASCTLPASITQPISGAATLTPPTGSTDPNCAKGCVVSITALSDQATQRRAHQGRTPLKPFLPQKPLQPQRQATRH